MILTDLVLTKYLLRARGIETEVPESGERTQDDPSGPDFDAAVAAFSAIGALTPEQVERWHARSSRLAAVDERAFAAERARLRDASLQLLEARERELALSTPAERESRRDEVAAAIDALSAIGLLSDEERIEREDRLYGDEAFEDPEELGPQLMRVERVVAGPAERKDGLRITLISLWEDGVVLHWHLVYDRPPDSYEGDSIGLPEFELEDDLGTEYEGFEAGGGGGLVQTGTSDFEPAVPREASVLRLRHREHLWEVPLR